MPRKISKKHIAVPLVYFFSLSIGMLLLLSYIAFTGTPDLGESYASDAEKINCEVAKAEEIHMVELTDEDNLLNDNIAQKIDIFFEKKNAPLAGYGSVFTREARKNEIDPTIVAAIAFKESTGGLVTPKINGETYNAWGYGIFADIETTLSVGLYDMKSWEYGIGEMSKVIRKYYYDKGLVEPHEIVTKYNKGSVDRAGGDPTNSEWAKDVNWIINEILSQEIDTQETSQ